MCDHLEPAHHIIPSKATGTAVAFLLRPCFASGAESFPWEGLESSCRAQSYHLPTFFTVQLVFFVGRAVSGASRDRRVTWRRRDVTLIEAVKWLVAVSGL